MPDIETFMPLIKISTLILENENKISTISNNQEIDVIKSQNQALEQQIIEEMSPIFIKIVKQNESKQVPLPVIINENLEQLMDETNERLHPAIQGVKSRMVNFAEIIVQQNEPSQQTLYEKLKKYGWAIVLIAAITLMLVLKQYWTISVDQPINTIIGLKQRSDALEKIIQYDDLMDTKTRRGGWIKSILFWPVEPTEEEIQYASEFLIGSTTIYNITQKDGFICNTTIKLSDESDTIEDQLEIAQIVSVYIQNDLKMISYKNNSDSQNLFAKSQYNDFEPSGEIIIAALAENFPCVE